MTPLGYWRVLRAGNHAIGNTCFHRRRGRADQTSCVQVVTVE
ncbi:hypothetical protein BZL30_1921 [Mycobacterium kansasii]|uniref:Uncharacterized protein n=1 Tax=Mycobacterium kansasii TaxID=1768 RepID=A0A1V3XJF1_MYCKA|nr:hypothetical protein BZL30_1921 [Mycobacterium kansasii]